MGLVLIPILMVLITAFIIVIAARQHFNSKDPNDLITAAFGNIPDDAFIFGKDKIGRYIFAPASAQGSICVFGPTGTGKTSCILINSVKSILSASNGTTCFVVDISGDILTNSSGGKKLIYSPFEEGGCKFNIFAEVDKLTNTDDKNELLSQMAYLIIPCEAESGSASEYFESNGRRILTAALICFYHLNLDFSEICQKIVSNNYKKLFEAIDSAGIEAATAYLNAYEGNSEKDLSSCYQVCASKVELFCTNRHIRDSIGRAPDAMTPSSLESSTCFVVIPDEKLELCAPLLHIITCLTFEYLAQRPMDESHSHTIALFLDEYSSLGKIDLLPILRKMRKRHVRTMICCQSISDLNIIYGADKTKALLENFRFWVILECYSVDNQKLFSSKIGVKKVTKRSISHSGFLLSGNQSVTESPDKEAIVEPASLAHMGNKLYVISPGGYRLLTKAPYYEKHSILFIIASKVHFIRHRRLH